MIDLHLHTQFSFDSNESPIKYISKYNISKFVQTDHAEFHPINNILYDPELYRNYLKQYNLTGLTGVEIGYHELCEYHIKNFLNEYEFDLVLMSIHTDSSDDYYLPRERFDFNQYIHLLNKVVDSAIEFNVLAHIDFPFRKNKYAISDFVAYEEKFVEFFKKLANSPYYLELNTSSIYKHDTLEIYTYLFNLYYKVGGRKVSIGSDAHQESDYQFKFKEAKKFINNYEGIELLNDKF